MHSAFGNTALQVWELGRVDRVSLTQTPSNAVLRSRICLIDTPSSGNLATLASLGFDAFLFARHETYTALRDTTQKLPSLLDVDLSGPDIRLFPTQDFREGVTDASESATSPVTAWTDRLATMLDNGISGFRFLKPHSNAAVTNAVAQNLRTHFPGALIILDAPGIAWSDLGAFPSGLYDYCTSSLPWWDFQSPWLGEEYDRLRNIAPILAATQRNEAVTPTDLRARIALSAVTGSGAVVSVDAGFEHQPDLRNAVASANALIGSEPILDVPGCLRIFRSAAHSIVFRADSGDIRTANKALVAVLGRNATAEFDRTVIADLEDFSDLALISSEIYDGGESQLNSLSLYRAKRVPPVRRTMPLRSAQNAAKQPRVIIEAVAPSVEGGRYPAKRIVGETVDVEATIFTDGHPVIAAELFYKAEDAIEENRTPLQLIANDRWTGQITFQRAGRHKFRIEAWIDQYRTFLRDIAKKSLAGKAITADLGEGMRLIEAACKRADSDIASQLQAIRDKISFATDAEKLSLFQDGQTQHLMGLAAIRPFLSRSDAFPIDVDRKAAVFSSWYEIFPRSAGAKPSHHGTFQDVIAEIPRVAAMGFDVLYLPPIHPIGKTNRKGPNNTLTALPQDVGSVYAIGAAEGGHDALHPALGTIDDFRALIAAARCKGIEIAFDFAIQCSPDHPWLKKHPGWFEWRPDGSIKYAENPPKVYEDIVNVDFYSSESIPSLWEALRDTVLFWAQEGIRLFRVDNPHTKPFAFWEWLIAEVRSVYPDAIFLAEAFTRPAAMYHLGKIGFSQSYTYFTWRNKKAEITTFIEEITQPSVNAFFRPHLFINTPDINPYFLQTSGPAGFLIRAALAATLSGLWGIFSGFELCEADALPGREEYRDSDKYQIRTRNWSRQPNITAEISALNRLRRIEPALQSHMGTVFHNAFNENVIYYAKQALGYSYRVLVLVCLDPHHAQGVEFELPLWEFGLSDDDSVAVTDLLSGASFHWHGKMQRATLTPDAPFRIWRISPQVGGEP